MQHNAESMKREIATIIRNMNDPRLHDTLISIVKIEMSKDSSLCWVYISSMGGVQKAQEAALVLKAAAGYIRTTLAARLEMRIVPKIIFKATDSIEYAVNIKKTLDGLKGQNEDEVIDGHSTDIKK